MNRLRDASDVGFITNNGRINDPGYSYYFGMRNRFYTSWWFIASKVFA